MTLLDTLHQQSTLPNQAIVMAILNLTPDSFSDGGQLYSGALCKDTLITRAKAALDEGALVLDIGGESTRPGAKPVSLREELQRVIPAIDAIRSMSDCVISIDTSRPEVMQAAIAAGANIINDVRALSTTGAMETAVRLNVPVCLMHMQGTPSTMQHQPSYHDVVDDVMQYLLARERAFVEAGGDAKLLLFDPGFGFGKTLQHNTALFKAIPLLVKQRPAWLIGVSRKTMLGQITGKDVNERTTASAVAAAMAVKNGVQIVRVHDVAATVDAINVFDSLSE